MSASCVEVTPIPELAPEAAVGSPHTVGDELRRLLHQSSHYLAGLLGKMSLGFVSLPIFTRIFSVADYGLIDFAGKILLLLTALSKVGLQNSALRFFDGKAFADNKKAEEGYYSTMFFGSLLSSAVVAVIFVGVTRILPSSVIDAPLASLLGFIAVLLVLRALSSMLCSFLRIEERTKAYNVWGVISKLVIIVGVCAALPFSGRNAGTFFYGSTAAELLVVAVLAFLLLRRGVLHLSQFEGKLFWDGLLFGAPLILYELSSIILNAGDRVLIRHYLGAEPLGVYSVAYGLAAQTNDLLILPLNLAILPIYLRLWRTQGQEATTRFLSTCLDLFLMAAAGVCAVAAVSARDGVVFLASEKYRAAGTLMPMLVIGLVIYTTHIFLSAGLLIRKKTGTMALLLLASAVVSLVMNCLLLPRIGLVASALATLVSYTFCVVILACASHRHLPLQIPARHLVKYVVIALVAAGAGAALELKPLVVNLAARITLTASIYVGLLYYLDDRVRRGAAKVFEYLGIASWTTWKPISES